MWERSSDFEVVLTVRGWMKKRQTKKKQNKEKQTLRKKQNSVRSDEERKI